MKLRRRRLRHREQLLGAVLHGPGREQHRVGLRVEESSRAALTCASKASISIRGRSRLPGPRPCHRWWRHRTRRDCRLRSPSGECPPGDLASSPSVKDLSCGFHAKSARGRARAAGASSPSRDRILAGVHLSSPWRQYRKRKATETPQRRRREQTAVGGNQVTLRMSAMRSSGLPSTTIRSARRPGAIVPLSSFEPHDAAGTAVAARIASIGERPASTYSSISRATLTPGTPLSVPATIGTRRVVKGLDDCERARQPIVRLVWRQPAAAGADSISRRATASTCDDPGLERRDRSLRAPPEQLVPRDGRDP